MSRALYLGHFDPPTLLHDDIITRAARLFGEVVIGVWESAGRAPLLPFEQRLALATTLWAGEGVQVRPASGSAAALLAATASDVQLVALRGIGDWEAALEESDHPRAFLMVEAAYLPVTSALVREIVRLKGDVSAFVPPLILARLQQAVQI